MTARLAGFCARDATTHGDADGDGGIGLRIGSEGYDQGVQATEGMIRTFDGSIVRDEGLLVFVVRTTIVRPARVRLLHDLASVSVRFRSSL